jgi:hypothetical protein
VITPETEARRDIADYMARDTVAYVGPFEAVFNAIFGPFDHDAHVKCRAAHIEAGSLADRLRAADEAVRAECARMSAEFNAKLARNSRPTLIAAE